MSELLSTYVLTQDTKALLRPFVDEELSQGPIIGPQIDRYFATLSGNLCTILAPSEIEILAFPEEQINLEISSRVSDILQNDPNSVCVCLDRFLSEEFRGTSFENRVINFSMCRTVDGRRVPRQGNPTFEGQFSAIKQIMPDIERKKIIIVDDGLFSGDTINTFLELAQQNGIRLQVEKVLGFIGTGQGIPDLDVETVQIIGELYDWVDLRDFGIFGGKMLDSSRTGKVSSAVPYIYPWSGGEDASLNMNPDFLTFSTDAIRAFIQLISEVEGQRGCKITFRDVLESRFPLPTNKEKSIPVSIGMNITDYLDRCLTLVEKEKGREVLIFDMDGTLYELDGENNGFEGSTLQNQVETNAITFIIDNENCTEAQARALYAEGTDSSIGLSAFLGDRYQISRSAYFDNVWNINPDGILQGFELTKDILLSIQERKPDTKFVLVTSAPKKWTAKVLQYLGIDETFEIIFTGEMYETKSDVFKILAGRYSPTNILSIGDQKDTDITPADDLGMNTLLVSGPYDLGKLV